MENIQILKRTNSRVRIDCHKTSLLWQKWKCINIFKRKKYTIRFKKSYQWVDFGNWKEVTDTHILYILSELQEKYNFEIVTAKLKDTVDESEIVIKCNKEDKNKIFMDFCMKLSRHI